MAAASVTPPGSLDLLQPGFSKTLLGTKLEAKYLCSACRNVLRRPFQAQCGHRYCSFCLTSILSSSGPQNCAACVHEGIYEEGISILESSSAFPDNAARREVESLPAVCPNDGCTWKGTLKEYESCHEGLCPFLLTECPACKGLVRLGEKERHVEQECPERNLNCQHCQEPCGHADLEFHDHVRTCGKCRVPCRFHSVGCPEMMEAEELQEHEAYQLREHLALVLSSLLEAQTLPGVQNQVGPQLLQRCQTLEQKTTTFENIVCVLNREVERVAVTAEACSRQHRLDQDKIEALSNKVQQLERSIGLKDLAMADLEQKVLELEASTYDGVFIWKISDFARKRQEAVAGRTPAIFSPVAAESREDGFQVLCLGLCSGDCVWPAFLFRARNQNYGEAGGAFYTSRYGYKMCLRVYLNGDGTGRGTHLSLFFVVMKGPNDALLRWPFNQKVTLMLLDQNNREHVIDAFRPDITSSSFQRPVSDMNIASGCPLFCPVSKMEAKNSYVRDDAIFIKAIVDLTGL
ncbi:TNF receptor-associated factor 2 isoform X3 [Ictidomys tridecemlineatus]|uniref:TNF receptor-associated factor 2 isoform X4 n=1 Tax=Ictidomys tridecemlineatus TaxID=43179 RepID=UPI001A9E357E|nr:TNF receptor-associated factor 2 isoform X4 [Ictidomys tridecemlineatus]